MSYVTVSAEVDVSDVLENLDDDDLIEALKCRGICVGPEFVKENTVHELLTKVWEKRRIKQNFDNELDQLIYHVLGKLV